MKYFASPMFKALLCDTLLKEVRSKTLIFMFLSTTIFILLFGLFFKSLLVTDTQFETNSLMKQFSTMMGPLSILFALINSSSTLLAIIFGIGGIRSDFKDKVIYQYLTFPITRTQYLFTRLIGTWLIVISFYFYSYLLASLVFTFISNDFLFSFSQIGALLIMCASIFVILLLTFFISSYVSAIGSFVLTLILLFGMKMSFINFNSLSFKDYFTNIGIFKAIGMFFYLFLPRVEFLSNAIQALLSNQKIENNIGLECIHLFLATSVLLLIFQFLFKKKNF